VVLDDSPIVALLLIGVMIAVLVGITNRVRSEAVDLDLTVDRTTDLTANRLVILVTVTETSPTTGQMTDQTLDLEPSAHEGIPVGTIATVSHVRKIAMRGTTIVEATGITTLVIRSAMRQSGTHPFIRDDRSTVGPLSGTRAVSNTVALVAR
jgi:hypothetical protein